VCIYDLRPKKLKKKITNKNNNLKRKLIFVGIGLADEAFAGGAVDVVELLVVDFSAVF
jgi:hypothetical protein